MNLTLSQVDRIQRGLSDAATIAAILKMVAGSDISGNGLTDGTEVHWLAGKLAETVTGMDGAISGG